MRQTGGDDVRVALCETNPTLRAAFQMALNSRGVREMEVCKDVSSLLATIDREIIDLIVCAVDLPGGEFCGVMQEIRQQTIGRNPFSLVLATISEATVEEIRRVINSGVDRVARKPISMGDMQGYVKALTTSRKPFVATDTYLGPSRRAAAREKSDPGEAIEVPNTLKAKVVDHIPAPRLERMIGSSMMEMRQLQARNGCVALWRMAQKLAEQHRDGMPLDQLAFEALGLIAKCREVESRYRGTGESAVAEVAASLVALVERLTQPDSATILPIILELMKKLGEVLRQVGQLGPESAPTMLLIAQKVRNFAEGGMAEPRHPTRAIN